MEKIVKRIAISCVLLIIVAVFSIVLINFIIIFSARGKMVNIDQVTGTYDAIIILGASVRSDGSPSPMLEDRLLRGLELYRQGFAPKILVSGDNGAYEPGYDEVNPMKNFLMSKGVPSEDIFMDHAGFNTYESMYRARHIFEIEKALVVTQEYHLYRAVYLARRMGMEVTGVSSDLRVYASQEQRDIREIFARVKAFFNGIFKPLPTYLGDVIPISGDGDITNDRLDDFEIKYYESRREKYYEY